MAQSADQLDYLVHVLILSEKDSTDGRDHVRGGVRTRDHPEASRALIIERLGGGAPRIRQRTERRSRRMVTRRARENYAIGGR